MDTLNPYIDMTEDELILIQQGLLQTVSRGYENSKTKISKEETDCLTAIIQNLTQELRKRESNVNSYLT